MQVTKYFRDDDVNSWSTFGGGIYLSLKLTSLAFSRFVVLNHKKYTDSLYELFLAVT